MDYKKKTQKTPKKEIEKALKITAEKYVQQSKKFASSLPMRWLA